MKIRNFLFMALATAALSSCSNDDAPKNASSFKGDVKLRLNLAAVSSGTRIADDNVAGGAKSGVNKVKLYFTNGDVVKKAENLDANKIKEITSDNGLLYKDLPTQINKVYVAINGKSELKIGDKVTEVSALPSNITEIQPTAKAKGVSNAPVYGTAPLNPTKVMGDKGNVIYEARVHATPTIARVQVYGKVAGSEKVENIKVTRIFLDNYKTSAADQKLFSVDQKTGKELDGALGTYGFFDKGADLQDKNKSKGVYAYHIYPQKATKDANKKKRCVNLIIEMTYNIKGEKALRTEYGTFSFATAGPADKNNTQGLTSVAEVKAATIYNINLGKIDWTGNGEYNPPADPKHPGANDNDDVFDPDRGGDTPNAGKIDAKVIVDLVPWTEQEIVPVN